jgi:hypothetical protein
MLEERALLSTLTVLNNADSGSGSLRDTISQSVPGDTINFDPSLRGQTIYLTSGELQINKNLDIKGLGGSDLTVSGSGSSRIFDITDSAVDATIAGLTITGGSADNGGGIHSDGTLTVIDSTITSNLAGSNSPVPTSGGGIYNDGTMTIVSSTITGNSAFYGGGIYNDGTMTILSSTITGNSASVSVAAYRFSGFGGGVYNVGELNVTDCTLTGNDASLGGAISNGDPYNGGGMMTLSSTTIANNSANWDGGVYNTGTATVTGCSITGNLASGLNGKVFSAGRGGGFGNRGNMSIANCMISDNSAASLYIGGASGGGIDNGGTLTMTDTTVASNSSAEWGGGIDNSGTVTATNCTIANNSAWQGGGGIHNTGTLGVTSSTISDNSGGLTGGGIFNDSYGGGASAVVSNSTIASNGAGTGGAIFNLSSPLMINNSTIAYNYGGIVTSGGLLLNNTIVALNTNVDIDAQAGSWFTDGANNLIGTRGSGGLVNGDNGNQVGIANPGLGLLADNGGPTQTIALLSGSPAIDAGSNSLVVDTTDQRGFARIVGSSVDIGAYEVQSLVSTVAVDWGSRTAALETGSDGMSLLPAGRNTDMPWLGITRVQITLSQAATLAAGDVTVTSASGISYGPVTVSGSGTSYTITLAHSIDAADRVTITIGNDLIASFTRRLDVLPGDVNDDGIVNAQDMVLIRNAIQETGDPLMNGWADMDGNGLLNVSDYSAARKKLGSHLP